LELLEGINYCNKTLDNYKITMEAIGSVLKSNTKEIFNLENHLDYSELSDGQKTQLSIGWQSDFNGWVDHGKPRFGKKGCYSSDKNQNIPPIEYLGLAHPGMLPDFWKILEKEGMDVDSVRRSSEKFLQMWEGILKRSNSN
jgi:hypothetical protein